MRTSRWRGLRAAAGVAACVLLMTGCGGGSDPEPEQTPAADGTADAAGPTPEQTDSPSAVAEGDGTQEGGSDPEGGAAADGDFCGTLEEFYQLSVLTLFGLALDPSPEVVDATLQSAELAAEVRPLAPPDIAQDLEPLLGLAEDLAAAMDGVDPTDPAAVTAAAESVPAYLTQDAELAADVDAYTEQTCGFTADSVAEDMISGSASAPGASSGAGSSGGTGNNRADAAAGVIPVDCEHLDAGRVAEAMGSEVLEVEQVGGSADFTYQLGEEQFHGTSSSCTVDVAGGEYSPPEVRIQFVSLGAQFYPRYRELARSEDAFAPAAVSGLDGFYYHETSFRAALVLDLSGGRALIVSASAGVSSPAPDRAALTTLGAAGLELVG